MEPESWTSKIVGACVGLLVAAIALNLAAALLAQIWQWLVIIIGGGTLVFLGVVVYRATRNHW